MANKTKKIIGSILIAGQLISWPFLALALPAINPVPTNNGGSSVENGIFSTALAIPVAAHKICVSDLRIFEAGDKVAKTGFSGLAMIGGDSFLLTQLAAEYNAYYLFIGCEMTALDAVKAIPTPNTYTYAEKQQYITEINSLIAAYKTKVEATDARYNNAKQGFWKTLVFNILIKTSKAVAQSLVTKLANTHTIRDYKQYADALATLTYDNQFIHQNFPDAQGQLMARAILENPQFRTQIPPGIFIAADAGLGFNPNAMDPNNPNFYSQMAAAGSSTANPYFMHTSYVAGVDQSHSLSLAYAQNQVTLSSGLKAPVNCAGTLTQQKNIDAQAKALSDKMNDRQNLVTSLQQAQTLNTNLSADDKAKLASDITKAQSDLNLATAAWNNAPDALASGNPAIEMCQAIVSPASFVSKAIDQGFNAVGVNMAQYNSNNLPAFMSIIGDVASQITTSFIFGGSGGAKNAAVINESKVANAAVAAGGEAAYGAASANLAKGINFTTDINASVPNSYTLSWQILTDTGTGTTTPISSAKFVTISGDGIASPSTHLPISGSMSIYTKVGGTYTLTVFDATGRVITAGSTDLTATNSGTLSSAASTPPASPTLVCGGNYPTQAACVAQNGQDYCNAICGTAMTDMAPKVAGASTSQPGFSIRGGPGIPFSARGD